MNHTFRHLGITVYSLEILESFCLNLSGSDYSFPDSGTWFSWGCLGDVLERYWTDFALDIDTVEERTGNLVHVSLDLTWCADTAVGRVAIVTARTWVHACYKHEGARIIDGVFGSADVDVAVFQRLAQNFQGGFVELW